MKLFMVIGSVDYEGGYVHGIYKTRKAAENLMAKLSKGKKSPCGRTHSADWFDVVETTTGRHNPISVPYHD